MGNGTTRWGAGDHTVQKALDIPATLDAESADWLRALASAGAAREAALARLHKLLVHIARREVARRAVAAVPSSGRVYRTGGEEFLVLLPGAGTAVCAAVAEEVRRAVRGEPVCGPP